MDRASRGAVQELLKNDCFYPPHTPSLVDAYKQECSKQGLALSNAFVLVQWGSIILHRCAKHPIDLEQYGSTVVQADAQVLEICMRSKMKSRRSVQVAALRSTKRAIRAICLSQGHDALKFIVVPLSTQAQPLGLKSAPMLGALGSACTGHGGVLIPYKKMIYAFYTREILGSRNPVPKHIAAGLKCLFMNVISSDDLQHDIVPTLEKALLRAPEVVLNDLITPLVDALPKHEDLAGLLANNLMKPLLACTKSQSDLIRSGAISAYLRFISHSAEEKAIQRITIQLIDSLVQSKAPVERQCIAQMLSGTPRLSYQSVPVCEALTNAISKETHEGALTWEARALFSHFAVFPPNSSSSIPNSMSVAAIKGLKDKKASVRRLWVLAIGDFVWSYFNSGAGRSIEVNGFIDDVLKSLLAVREEVVQNPLLAAQSGFAVGAFIVTAIWPIILREGRGAGENDMKKTNSSIDQALTYGSTPSFLLSHKIYSKLDPQDIHWLVRALNSCSIDLSKSPAEVQIAWGEAFTYAVVAAGTSSATRHLAMSSLESIYLKQRTVIADAIIQALWKWHRDIETEKKDAPATAARTGVSRLIFVLRCICPSSASHAPYSASTEQTEVQSQLMDLLVLCRPEIIPGAHWIGMCLRMDEDPGLIARTRPSECFNKVDGCLPQSRGDVRSVVMQLAAHNAAAELAFVSPDAIIPLLVHTIQKNLSGDEVSHHGPTEIAIARTPEGTAFVDVLNTQSQTLVIHKSSPDYEIVKWEQEMRSQIAQKKGQQKKLTADEKTKLNAQLEKEAAIRREVHETEEKIKKGAGYVHALAVGPPTDAKLWMGPSLQALLEVISAGAGRLIGVAADDAYLACSVFVSSRLDTQRRFVGIATLRAAGSSTVPDELLQEPLRGTTSLALGLSFLTTFRPYHPAAPSNSLHRGTATVRRCVSHIPFTPSLCCAS